LTRGVERSRKSGVSELFLCFVSWLPTLSSSIKKVLTKYIGLNQVKSRMWETPTSTAHSI
jgi:TctA family transporter